MPPVSLYLLRIALAILDLLFFQMNFMIAFSVSMNNILLNKTPKAQEIKSNFNKWDGLKLKSCFSAKETMR